MQIGHIRNRQRYSKKPILLTQADGLFIMEIKNNSMRVRVRFGEPHRRRKRMTAKQKQTASAVCSATVRTCSRRVRLRAGRITARTPLRSDPLRRASRHRYRGGFLIGKSDLIETLAPIPTTNRRSSRARSPARKRTSISRGRRMASPTQDTLPGSSCRASSPPPRIEFARRGAKRNPIRGS